MEKHWRYLFHLKVAYDTYDMRVCHDFDLRSFVQVKGQWKEKCKICLYSIFLLWKSIGSSYYTKPYHLKVCQLILTQGHLGNLVGVIICELATSSFKVLYTAVP